MKNLQLAHVQGVGGIGMNIQMLRLKPIVRELRRISEQLERMADCWEIELSRSGYNVRPPVADTSGPEPTVSYVDEEEDWAREQVDYIRRQEERLAKEHENE